MIQSTKPRSIKINALTIANYVFKMSNLLFGRVFNALGKKPRYKPISPSPSIIPAKTDVKELTQLRTQVFCSIHNNMLVTYQFTSKCFRDRFVWSSSHLHLASHSVERVTC